MDYSKFSNIELINIVEDINYANEAFVNIEDDLLNDIASFREHAFAAYFGRYIDFKIKVCDSDLKYLFKYIKPQQEWTVIAISFLGGFAESNLLDIKQCKECLKYLDTDDWSYKQLLVRIKLLTIDKVSEELITFILDKGATWAIYEILPGLSIELIKFLKNELEIKKLLNKSNRNNLLQILDKRIKVYEKK